eukprot:CAMPEP_0206563116 /NCGR_PEP_ID=MMETSP0325_2-20121206/22657_1 /ASSEMBLY_ACC=CAM_ASM_000347 /TAXON_ID=2866 /ORGANISM="Crypthecodinium cohnii, Strain Seligo" /LENGTH=216 /DNA_ID=CAMNT_0054065465 /DNA_START=437 /DNA_END=1089 /DNA_ORIENTATION=-
MVFSIIGDLHSSRAAIFPCLGPPGLCNLNCEGGVDDGGRLEGPVGIGEGGGEGERPCETDLGGGVSPRPPRPRTTPGTDAVVDPVDARSLGSRNPLVLGDFRTDAKPVEIGPDMGTMLAAHDDVPPDSSSSVAGTEAAPPWAIPAMRVAVEDMGIRIRIPIWTLGHRRPEVVAMAVAVAPGVDPLRQGRAADLPIFGHSLHAQHVVRNTEVAKIPS